MAYYENPRTWKPVCVNFRRLYYTPITSSGGGGEGGGAFFVEKQE